MSGRITTSIQTHPQVIKLRGLAILLLVLVLIARTGMLPIERSIFLSVYGWPVLLWPIFLLITQTGSVMAAAAAIILTNVKRGKEAATQLAYAAGSAFILTEVLKHIVARPRPQALLPQVAPQDMFTRGGYGFPSGHAAIITVLALFAFHVLPKRFHKQVIILTALVYVSRVFLGMHLPLDVVGGAVVGAFTSLYFFDPKLLAKRRRRA